MKEKIAREMVVRSIIGLINEKKRLQEVGKYAAMHVVEEALRKGFGCKA